MVPFFALYTKEFMAPSKPRLEIPHGDWTADCSSLHFASDKQIEKRWPTLKGRSGDNILFFGMGNLGVATLGMISRSARGAPVKVHDPKVTSVTGAQMVSFPTHDALNGYAAIFVCVPSSALMDLLPKLSGLGTPIIIRTTIELQHLSVDNGAVFMGLTHFAYVPEYATETDMARNKSGEQRVVFFNTVHVRRTLFALTGSEFNLHLPFAAAVLDKVGWNVRLAAAYAANNSLRRAYSHLGLCIDDYRVETLPEDAIEPELSTSMITGSCLERSVSDFSRWHDELAVCADFWHGLIYDNAQSIMTDLYSCEHQIRNLQKSGGVYETDESYRFMCVLGDRSHSKANAAGSKYSPSSHVFTRQEERARLLLKDNKDPTHAALNSHTLVVDSSSKIYMPEDGAELSLIPGWDRQNYGSIVILQSLTVQQARYVVDAAAKQKCPVFYVCDPYRFLSVGMMDRLKRLKNTGVVFIGISPSATELLNRKSS